MCNGALCMKSQLVWISDSQKTVCFKTHVWSECFGNPKILFQLETLLCTVSVLKSELRSRDFRQSSITVQFQNSLDYRHFFSKCVTLLWNVWNPNSQKSSNYRQVQISDINCNVWNPDTYVWISDTRVWKPNTQNFEYQISWDCRY